MASKLATRVLIPMTALVATMQIAGVAIAPPNLKAAATWRIGPDQTYKTPSALFKTNLMAAGDLVQIDACTYTDDFNPNTNSNDTQIKAAVTITAVKSTSPNCVPVPDLWNGSNSSKPVLAHITQSAGAKTIEKGLWNIEVPNVTIDHIAFTGARAGSGDDNGAGLRIETGGLVTIKSSFFGHNQNGILGGNTGATIRIDRSEFDHNGTAGCLSACTHHVYLSGNSVVITKSYFHDLVPSGNGVGTGCGNGIKSRANMTQIDDSRIYDGVGCASYTVDIPQGGTISMSRNVLQQSATTDNPTIMDTGENGADQPMHSSSYMALGGNTFVNDYTKGSVVGVHNGSSTTLQFLNSKYWGLQAAFLVSGPNTQSGNTLLDARPVLDVSSPIDGDGAVPPKATASLSAKSLTTLTWSSMDATNCVGTGFDTGNATSGMVSLATPKTSTTYSVNCSGATASVTAP